MTNLMRFLKDLWLPGLDLSREPDHGRESNLDELLACMTPESFPEQIDSGIAVGREDIDWKNV
jgi:hypothetical protein